MAHALLVAGASGGGGASAALAEASLSGTAATIDFTSIPASYRHLWLEVLLRTDRAAQVEDAINISFNGDTTDANYDQTYVLMFGTTTTPGEYVAGAAGSRSVALATAATAPANQFTSGHVDIPDYGGATFKSALADTLEWRGRSSGNVIQYHKNIGWASTAVINRITLASANAANFIAGCRVTLYGIKGVGQ